jgi:hypothetical protein
MYYVGLDIQTKRNSVCVLNATGRVLRCCQVRTLEEMMRILEGLPDPEYSHGRSLSDTKWKGSNGRFRRRFVACALSCYG